MEAAYSERSQGRCRLYEALLFRGYGDLHRGRAYGAAKKWDAPARQLGTFLFYTSARSCRLSCA